ncbi:MAG: restriction endonuclease subunit S, partial [Bergeyella zoohelcum]|nr:restriction endonuclease subunit S [Bergeyella zoohelcum]
MTYIQKLLNGEKVEWKQLGEVAEIKTGKLNANAAEKDGVYPFFTCNEEPYRINSYAFDMEAILISGNGSQVGHVNYYKGKFNAYQRTYVLG